MLSQVYVREKRYADAATTQQWRLDIWTGISGENGVPNASSSGYPTSNAREATSSPPKPTPCRVQRHHDRRYVDHPGSRKLHRTAEILAATNNDEAGVDAGSTAEKTFETALGPASPLTIGIAKRRAMIQNSEAATRSPCPPKLVLESAETVTQPRIL